MLDNILHKGSLKPYNLSYNELIYLLALEDKESCEKLFQAAYSVKLKEVGNKVNLRGLIEMSNICAKDCFYCGIRKSNANVERFQLDKESILRMANWAYEQNYGSVVLQAGEIESKKNSDLIEDLVQNISKIGDGSLGITLSLGEQSWDTYQRWLDAGAHRYLLRIESSTPELYHKLHPQDHSYERRVECLKILTKIGFQTGTGVLIGVPNQTLENLANDILFFKAMNIGMIGMGPYLPHIDTPLGKDIQLTSEYSEKQLTLGLKMIATTRLFLHDVNIASTTALQALANNGRELGLLAGANVIMPNVTDTQYRKNYQLYAQKPAINENSEQSRDNLTKSIQSIGEEINWGVRGDAPHYSK